MNCLEQLHPMQRPTAVGRASFGTIAGLFCRRAERQHLGTRDRQEETHSAAPSDRERMRIASLDREGAARYSRPMRASRLLHFALHPIYALRRVSYRVYEALHPNDPWISQGAIRFCEGALRKDMRAVETGSGRSTAWFAHRVGHLTSIEHDEAWHAKIQTKLRGLSNVDYRFVALDHAPTQETRPVYEQLPKYVAVFSEFDDDSLDFVIIDGHYRQACLLAALKKLKPGGMLLVDNSNWMSQSAWGVPESWPLLHRSENVMTQTSIWKKP